MANRLVKVLDLIGKTPLRVDLRSRTADGELRHPHTAAEGARDCVLTRVEIRKKRNHRTGEPEQWLYWMNGPVNIPGMVNCGYSGQRMDGRAEHEIYLEVLP